MKIIQLALVLGITAILGKYTAQVWQKTTLSEKISNGYIQGTVKEADNHAPIPYCNVSITHLSTQKNYVTTTGFQGEFLVKDLPVGKYECRVSMVGYIEEKKMLEVTENIASIIEFNLHANATVISEMEILEEPAEKSIVRDMVQGVATTSICSKSASRKDKKNVGYTSYVTQPNADFNTEAYDAITENDFKEAKSSPLSTFSIDVDAASYSNFRRFVSSGQTPPKDAVRVEEMINYFTYDYPEPQGENPFSITTEMSQCPWNTEHKLVHIGLQGKRLSMENLPPSNIVFLIDVSGSMQAPNKLPLLKQSLHLLIDQMRPQDKIAMVVYAGAAGLVLESTSGNKKDKIRTALDNLEAGGSTAGGAGIKLAYEVALENYIKGGNNRVILATDGDFNVGASSDGEMVELIEKKRETGVFLTVLGYGMGNYKDSKMEKLSDKGNGNYAYIDNLMEAKKVLVNEVGATMFTIAKDVKLQIEFNPALVSRYKLIGYENRLLQNEDFNDDTKDAGELGAGHSVTALYEIVPVSSNAGQNLVDPLKYQKPEPSTFSTNSNELLTVKFRYKDPNGTKSKLIERVLYNSDTPLQEMSNDYRFSAAVAEFGLYVRDSKHKGTANITSVINLAKSGKGKDDDGYRAEFIRLVEMYQLVAKTN